MSDGLSWESMFSVEELSKDPLFHLTKQIYQTSDWTVQDFLLRFSASGAATNGNEQIEEPLSYWDKFIHEFKILTCTQDKKYNELRKRLTIQGERGQMALVSTIAAALGAQIGAAATIITPCVILALIVLIKIGKEAFCRAQNINTVKPELD